MTGAALFWLFWLVAFALLAHALLGWRRQEETRPCDVCSFPTPLSRLWCYLHRDGRPRPIEYLCQTCHERMQRHAESESFQ